MLELDAISKLFREVKALTIASFKGEKKQEILAVVGENGAGNPPWMKILSGVYPHGGYEGRFYLEGEESLRISRKAKMPGFRLSIRSFVLCKLMNVTENIYLGNEIRNKFGAIDWNESIKKRSFT